MKKLITFFILVILIIGSCNNNKDDIITTEIYIFIDVTDTLNRDRELLTNGIPEILKKMKLSTTEGGLSGGTIKYFLLSETSASPYKTVTIEKGEGGVFDEKSNKYVRGDEIKKFKEEIEFVIDEILTKEIWEKQNSKIYQQVCRELNRMELTASDQKLVIIYSDMLENSQLFSFYSWKNINTNNDYNQIVRWMSSDTTMKKAYENILALDCKFPDLNNISIYMISNRNSKNDEKINMAEKFWASLFKLNNAQRVHYGAELKIYE